MLFFICVGILLAGIICLVIYNKLTVYNGALDVIGPALTFIGAILVFVSIVIFLLEYIPAQSHHEQLEVERASLVYQYDNNMYDNDNDIGKKELMFEIQDYNEKLVHHKIMQRNFLVGIYYANIYDDLECIELR